MFKLDPTEEGAKLDDPELDKELVHLVLDKVDQVLKLKSNFALIIVRTMMRIE